jgi:hypothetical protein
MDPDRVAKALRWAAVLAARAEALRRLGIEALGTVHAALRERRGQVNLPPMVGEVADRVLDWLGTLVSPGAVESLRTQPAAEVRTAPPPETEPAAAVPPKRVAKPKRASRKKAAARKRPAPAHSPTSEKG